MKLLKLCHLDINQINKGISRICKVNDDIKQLTLKYFNSEAIWKWKGFLIIPKYFEVKAIFFRSR